MTDLQPGRSSVGCSPLGEPTKRSTEATPHISMPNFWAVSLMSCLSSMSESPLLFIVEFAAIGVEFGKSDPEEFRVSEVKSGVNATARSVYVNGSADSCDNVVFRGVRVVKTLQGGHKAALVGVEFFERGNVNGTALDLEEVGTHLSDVFGEASDIAAGVHFKEDILRLDVRYYAVGLLEHKVQEHGFREECVAFRTPVVVIGNEVEWVEGVDAVEKLNDEVGVADEELFAGIGFESHSNHGIGVTAHDGDKAFG